MKKAILISIYLFFALNSMTGQACGAFEEHQAAMRAFPGEQARVDQYLADLLTTVRQVLTYLTHPELHQSPVTIPVVVHIVHKNNSENFTNAEVNATVLELTSLFRKRNAATIRSNVPQAFRGRASDSYIEFELAKRDPEGNRTNGITRRRVNGSTYPSFTANNVKSRSTGGVDAWDESKYLNIWVCDLPTITLSNGSTGNLLGVGTFPENPNGHQAHGVVMDYMCFAPANRSWTNYREGKTLVHEVGHYLGLRHIWGDSGGNDFVDDTPSAQSNNFSCPTFPHRVTASNTPNGEMFMNYMDYVNHNCMHLFTRGQVARMLANLKPGARRASLLTSDALLRPGLRERSHRVYLEAERPNWPAWKVSFLMTYRWLMDEEEEMSHTIQAVETTVEDLVRRQSGASFSPVSGLPQEVSNYANSLAYEVEELNVSYTPDAFYDMLTVPVIILSVGSTSIDTYGLVIKGLGYHEDSNTTYLRVLDPLNIGARGFNFNYSNYSTPVTSEDPSGSEYIVNYGRFMSDAIDNAVINQKRIYLLYPPEVRTPN